MSTNPAQSPMASTDAASASQDAAAALNPPVDAPAADGSTATGTAESAAQKAAAPEAPLPPPVDEMLAKAAVDIRTHVEELSEAVLDSAEVATRSAAAAVRAGTELKAAAAQLNLITDRSYKQSRIILASVGGLMLLALIFFVVMGSRMISRINQLDVMLLAVGKRVVELNAGLEALNNVNLTLGALAEKQDAMTQASTDVQSRIDQTLKQAEAMVQQVPAATAKEVAATGENLAKQVQGLNSRMQAQATAVQNLSTQVGALKGSVANVDKLNRDVQALVTLQRERYLEALQRNNAAALRERSVQYPRMPNRAAAEEGAAPTTQPPGPVVQPKTP
jgi:hypothetical protein